MMPSQGYPAVFMFEIEDSEQFEHPRRSAQPLRFSGNTRNRVRHQHRPIRCLGLRLGLEEIYHPIPRRSDRTDADKKSMILLLDMSRQRSYPGVPRQWIFEVPRGTHVHLCKLYLATDSLRRAMSLEPKQEGGRDRTLSSKLPIVPLCLYIRQL
ncbi:hypothetical protein BJY00DRAFT_80025 [Aspergillus carlsbadensis]|nr:hypothetical protein BJY00DRAFT_80025 [Aspergillus carlsbadensis]